MACNLITNKARTLRKLKDSGIIGDSYNVLDSSKLEEVYNSIKKEAEEILESKVPYNINVFEVVDNSFIPNNDLFYRLDAAEDIIYEENEQYYKNYQYPVEEKLETNSISDTNEVSLNDKLTDLLSHIGVSVEESKYLNSVNGISDTLNKAVYLSMNKAGLESLPEEAAHMFVEFIEQNDSKLFNTMMADIPKYEIYQEVKDEYLPIYNDINKVKKEAIGKAISAYLVNNETTLRKSELSTWFDKVLDLFKQVLAKFGIKDTTEYNNYFQITADKILKGDFQGELQPSVDRNFLQVSDNSPLSKLDAVDTQLELRDDSYYFNSKKVKWRVTDKIKKGVSDPISPIQQQKIDWGTKGHEDLKNIWNIALGKSLPENIVVNTNPSVFTRLQLFVEVIKKQFPNSNIRTEVKVYDPVTDTAGTIDLVIEDKNGVVHIFDYKFIENPTYSIKENWNEQLKEYKRILQKQYGFSKFGQIRIIPIKSEYSDKEGSKYLENIQIGSNTLEPNERNFLNPLPALFEESENEKVNRAIQFLKEELLQTEKSPVSNESERQNRYSRIQTIKSTIAKLQISNDITSLSDIVESDKVRMEYIMSLQDPTASDLEELYKLKEYYKEFISNRYNIDSEGNASEMLTNISVYAQQESETIDKKLEDFWNTQGIDINRPNKPSSKWNVIKRLSDYDIPAFQALYKILNKGFNETEIKINKEYDQIKQILEKIKQESGKSDSSIYDPILQKNSKGEKTGKLIAKNSSTWYDMHREVYNDTKIRNKLTQYFDLAKYKEYIEPILEDFKTQRQGLSEEKLQEEVQKFIRYNEKYVGIGNPDSRFFNIPDKFLNPDYVTYVKNNPESGLAQLYNKFIQLNSFAIENCDSNLPKNALPYIRKNTIEMLMNDGFNLKNLTSNALDKLKVSDWETFEIDSNGQKVYKIPLKYSTNISARDLNQQSYDLGEMMLLWAETVYMNDYLQKTHSTTKLYSLALKKSKEVLVKNGKPVIENGELRTVSTDQTSLDQFQQYINMYYYGVKSEANDLDIAGYSGKKLLEASMKYLSAKAIGFNVFSGLANLTGGFSNAISIGSKNKHFTIKQLGKAVKSLADPKVRGLISLMDVASNSYDKEKATNLSASKVEKLLSWNNLFVLQQKGDWLLQNSVLGAMAQNYTIKDNKIIKKTDEDVSLLEKLNYDKNGNLVIEDFDLTDNNNYIELLKFREKVRGVSSEIIGTTSPQDKFLAGNTLATQLLLQFRRWMLPMAISRFGKLTYNSNLQDYQLGKYRSSIGAGWDYILAKANSLIKEQNSVSLEDILLKRYEEAQILNPDITYEEFKKLYIENCKSVLSELAILSLITGVLAGLKGDDDDEKEPWKRFLYRGLTRTGNELSFWYNPDSFSNILKMPIPIVSLATDLTSLMGAFKDQSIGFLMGDLELQDKAKPTEKVAKMTVGLNAYYGLMKELDKED